MYKSISEKAAVYVESLAQYHVFFDGNKRTAFAVAARFLFQNGYRLIMPNEEVVAFMLHTVVHKPELKEIANRLKKHVKKIGK